MLKPTRYLHSGAVQVDSARRQTAQFDWILFMITHVRRRHYTHTQHTVDCFTASEATACNHQDEMWSGKVLYETVLHSKYGADSLSKCVYEP